MYVSNMVAYTTPIGSKSEQDFCCAYMKACVHLIFSVFTKYVLTDSLYFKTCCPLLFQSWWPIFKCSGGRGQQAHQMFTKLWEQQE